MSVLRRIAGLALALILLAFLFSLSVADAKNEKKKFVPKTGEERQQLMLAPVEKRFVVTPNTKTEALERIGTIENAAFVVDGQGNFPPKSLLETLAKFEKPITLMLPLNFTEAHKRRLQVLNDNYDCSFLVTKDTLTPEVVNRMLGMGPRRKIVELSTSDLTTEVGKQLKALRQFDLHVSVPEGAEMTAEQVKFLDKLPGVKELVLPAGYPVKSLGLLKNMKQTKILLRSKGLGPERELVTAVNGLGKKMESGTIVRGLIKPDEIKNHILLDNLRVFVFYLEEWEVTDAFVTLMNSRGQ